MAKQIGNSREGTGGGRTALRIEDVLSESGGGLAGINWQFVQRGPHVLLQIDTSPDGCFTAPEHIVTVATLFNVNLSASARRHRQKIAADP